MCLLFDWDSGQLEAIFDEGDLDEEEPPTRPRQFGGPVDLRPGERLEVLPVWPPTGPQLPPYPEKTTSTLMKCSVVILVELGQELKHDPHRRR